MLSEGYRTFDIGPPLARAFLCDRKGHALLWLASGECI